MTARAIVVALLLPITALARPPEPNYRVAVQIVVDLSAPMAARFGDKPIFRQALEASIKSIEARPPLPASVELSWRTVGGGPPDDEATCESTQLLVPPGVTPGPALRPWIPRLVAQGKRPLGAALMAAVGDEAREAIKQRSLIVITSGVDDCEHDVCLAATELRDSNGLGNVNVILTSQDPGAAAKLKCLGKVTVVRDASSLTKAVAEAIDGALDPADVTFAALEDGREIPAIAELFAVGDKKPVLRTSTGTPVQVAGGVYDVRVMKPARAPDDDSPRSVDPDAEGIRQNIEIFGGSQLVLRVPLGGQHGQLVTNVTFNGEPAPSGTRIAVYRAGETEMAVASGDPGESIAVPPGRYDVRAVIPGGSTGTIEVWKPDVTVTSGGAKTVSLAAAQRRGAISVKVVSDGQPVEGASFALLAPGAQGGDGEAFYEAGIEIPYPTGHYSILVHLQTGAGMMNSVREGVTIAQGRTSELTIDIGPTAVLTIEVAGRVAEDGIAIALSKPGSRETLGLLATFAPQRLPPGKYDLRIDDSNAPVQRAAALQRVELKAGEKRLLTLTPL